MPYTTNLLDHIRAIHECARKFSARVDFDLATGHLDVRAAGRRVSLLAQFAFHHESGSIGYSEKLVSQAEFFVGWRPYFNRVWPLAFDKRHFKEYCRSEGVATPGQWNRPQDVQCDVLKKRGVSAFSEGISGPYTAAAVQSTGVVLREHEFFEEFIRGNIVKVWYWNQYPVSVESFVMPTVVGDGHRTLRQLINRIKLAHEPGDWTAWEQLAHYQGLALDAVVPTGREVLVEYRYLSSLHPVAPTEPNLNALASLAGTVTQRQLLDAGEIFWKGIPADIRQDTLYTVDGILDPAGKVWFVEVNCNPLVHPDAYWPMFESLFGASARDRVPQQPQPRLRLAATG